MINKCSYPLLSTVAPLNIFSNLSLIDLLKCEETCSEINNTIALIFHHNREELGKIFQSNKGVFSIKLSSNDLKVALCIEENNLFFNQPCLKEFMNDWTLKLVEDALKPIIYGFEGNDSKYQRPSLKNGPSQGVRNRHPLFEEEMFFLFEKYDCSSVLVNAIKKNLFNKFLEFFENPKLMARCFHACNRLIKDFSEDKTLRIYTGPLIEKMYDALFEVYVKYHVSSYSLLLQNKTGFYNNFTKMLQNFDSSEHIVTNEATIHLAYLNGALTRIGEGREPGLALTKPHVKLEDRVRNEYYNALKALQKKHQFHWDTPPENEGCLSGGITIHQKLIRKHNC